MNKLLIFLLVVCLVSVHAFVKRDAPPETATQANQFEEILHKADDALKDVGKKLQENFDPEKIKEGFNNLLNEFNKGLENMKKPEEQKS